MTSKYRDGQYTNNSNAKSNNENKSDSNDKNTTLCIHYSQVATVVDIAMHQTLQRGTNQKQMHYFL